MNSSPYYFRYPLFLTFILAVFWVAAAALSAQSADDTNPRQRLRMDQNWKFHVDESLKSSTDGPTPPPATDDFNDQAWTTVHLPHDYVVESDFDEHADRSHGFHQVKVGAYRRTFNLPDAWKGKVIWIDFDGIFSDAKIWFNGKFLGEHRSGYIGAHYDLTSLARFGQSNTLAVYVDPRKFEGWWYEGGGIYRHVWLNAADPVHLVNDSTFIAPDIHADPEVVSTEAPVTLKIKTTVINQSDSSAACTVTTKILDSQHQLVGTVTSPAQTLAAGNNAEFALQLDIPKATLWSIETPVLYQAITTVQKDNQTIDQVQTPFGCRTIRFDPDRGFLLNGQVVKIKGTCNHQDFAGIGIALTDDVLDWRIRKLKEVGSNGYRTSHNPVASELLDDCDRQGMLVMDETRHLGDTYNATSSPNTPATDLTDFSDMVRRDRNHPCVIMWSVANEEPIQGTPEGGKLALAMKQRADQLDGTRPVSAAQNHGHGDPGGFSDVLDLEGFNYYEFDYVSFHQSHPKRPMFGSETASSTTTRGIYTNHEFKPEHGNAYYGDPEKGYVDAYDVPFTKYSQTTEVSWTYVAKADFMAGAFVWTGFDYRGEPTPFGWPCINSHFGFMDTCGFPKDTYFYYLAWWGDKPIVHLLPHWNWPDDKGELPVFCHSNCEQVELFLNDRSLGVKKIAKFGHAEWKVPYEKGTLEVRGSNGGQVVATEKIETTGPAAALKLDEDRPEYLADGEETAIIPVTVLDEQGRYMPTADNDVSFSVTGPGVIIGVGNGDPSSHEPDKSDHRHAFNGRCLVLVQSKFGETGTVTLTASAPGLKSATLTWQTKPPTIAELP